MITVTWTKTHWNELFLSASVSPPNYLHTRDTGIEINHNALKMLLFSLLRAEELLRQCDCSSWTGCKIWSLVVVVAGAPFAGRNSC